MKHEFAYFDLSGTLLEKKGLIATIAAVLSDAGFAVSPDRVAERHKLISEATTFPVTTSKLFYDAFNAELSYSLGVIPTNALVDEIYRRCRALEWTPFDDVGALAELGLPLGIISNWDVTIGGKLARHFPGLHFERVIDSHSLGVAKPDLALYKAALDGLCCAPAQVLYVGDSLKLDVAPALAMGMDAVLLDRTDSFLAYRGKRIQSLTELALL